MLRLGIVGASGRTGSEILRLALADPRFDVSAAVVSPESPMNGREVSGGAIRYAGQRPPAESCDIWIDFSTPAGSLLSAEMCAEMHVPLLIGTTGIEIEQRRKIESAAAHCPIAVVPNTSVGVLVLTQLVTAAKRLLGDSYDVEICEIHHRGKKDAPSGTALQLAAAADSGLNKIVRHRDGHHQREQGEVGLAALRGGDVVGEHTVYFFGDGERIELTHRARDRSIFAAGALRLGAALAGRRPGLYTAADLLCS